MMKIQVQADFQVSDQLQELIEEKVTKLNTFFDRILSTTVYLRNMGQRHQQADESGNIAEIRMEIPNHSLYAQASAESMEKALAAVSEKMRRQLKKQKQLMNGK